MTDRELLEAAAKAAGELHVTRMMIEWGKWNPLLDDGDALRLAVALDMIVSVGRVEFGDFDAWDDAIDMPEEDVRADPYAATRRAIVRAAAAIGEQSASLTDK